jgi:hypothetical protein
MRCTYGVEGTYTLTVLSDPVGISITHFLMQLAVYVYSREYSHEKCGKREHICRNRPFYDSPVDVGPIRSPPECTLTQTQGRPAVLTAVEIAPTKQSTLVKEERRNLMDRRLVGLS